MKLKQCTRNLILNVSVLDLVFTSINQHASNAEPQSDQQQAKYLKPPRSKHLIPNFSIETFDIEEWFDISLDVL